MLILIIQICLFQALKQCSKQTLKLSVINMQDSIARSAHPSGRASLQSCASFRQLFGFADHLADPSRTKVLA